MLGEKNPTLDKFRAALAENGAEFPVSKTVNPGLLLQTPLRPEKVSVL